MSLKTIKGKIRSIEKTQTVTKAMEAVSAAKMRKAQERALSLRPYARSAFSILSRLSGSIDALHHPLTTPGSGERELIILIMSDKGLAGNLNSAVLRKVQAYLADGNLSPTRVDFICIGKKGADFAAKRGFSILYSAQNDRDDVSLADLEAVQGLVAQTYESGAYRRAVVVYQNFRSTFECAPTLRQMLPISVEAVRDAVRGITPQKGKYAQKEDAKEIAAYTIEPDPERVLSLLMPYILSILTYHALLESKASEHSARMVAMKNASEKAEELGDASSLEYNKARQAAITGEVSEITSGIEAMN